MRSTSVGAALARQGPASGRGSPSARLDAEVLLAHATGRDRSWILAHPEAELDADAGAAFAASLDRRAQGEPIAYIRGFKEWRSLRIRTDARALIPRPETELLAEAAMAEIADRLTRDDAARRRVGGGDRQRRGGGCSRPPVPIGADAGPVAPHRHRHLARGRSSWRRRTSPRTTYRTW